MQATGGKLMKFPEIFRFEFAYQIRRVSTWLYFAVLAIMAFLVVRGNYLYDAREGYHLLDAPYVIAATTVIVGLNWLLIAASVAGNSAARDVQTRMYPLIYTSPISKYAYLGGRFLASFVVNALILLGVPAGILIAMYAPGVEPEILGSFRSAAYLSAYAIIALPNAFFATALQFSLSALNRRARGDFNEAAGGQNGGARLQQRKSGRRFRSGGAGFGRRIFHHDDGQ
jgi:ABC-type transport system involved in multi-copper enzyme maturation permease subunit